MSMIIDGTNGATFPDSSLQAAASSPYVLKNRIINGAMVIDQRNAGASGTGTNNYTVDRWTYYATQSGKLTWQQNAGSVTPPTGFTNYMGFTSSSAYSIAAGDVFVFEQRIEGYNMADFAWGTANAKTITISFWVRSSLTGTFGGSIINNAYDRSYVFSYTINAANTWEQKTITISGCTDGTWVTNNGIGARIYMGLCAGSSYTATAGSWLTGVDRYGVTGQTNIVGTNGATWYITGVQLEIGTSATPFERRLYGQELINCQRYYQKFISVNGAYCTFGTGHIDSATAGYGTIVLPVTTRAAATFGSSGSIGFYSGNSFYPITSFGTVYYTLNTQGVNFTCSGGGMTAGRGGQIIANNSTTAYVDFNAEL